MTIDHGNARIFTVGSSSDENKSYTVYIAVDPAYSRCDCPAFFYGTARSASKAPTCKHVALLEGYGAADQPVGFYDGLKRTDVAVDDVADLFEKALSWVDNDLSRAVLLVRAYLTGREQS